MSEDIITQVAPEQYSAIGGDYDDSADFNSNIHLDIRGRQFTITRDELMGLPELILLCLFPNGVFLDINGQVIANLTEDDTVYVNFDPDCFQYIIDVFSQAQHELDEYPQLPDTLYASNRHENVLQHKPAIIVLREDLDYYVIPPKPGMNHDHMRHLKLEVSSHLLHNQLIFLGLGYDLTLPPSVEQHLGPAEQHLFDMLCSLGFDRGGEWGIRSMEPNKCVISLLLLVRLRTNPPESSGQLTPVESNVSQDRSRSRLRLSQLALSASRAASRSLLRLRKPEANHTKLLLFWRKPARKCWWLDEVQKVNVKGVIPGLDVASVKVHIRRVWTLELSVVGVQ